MATVKETDKRLEDNNIRALNIHRPTIPKNETAILTTINDTMNVPRTVDYLEMTYEEKGAMFLQTIMVWDEIFIKVDDINDIWSQILKDANININTGVKYRHRDFAETLYSANNSVFFVNSTKLEEYKTGVDREISLHGYYVLTFKALFQYSKKEFIFYIVIGSILLLSLIITYFLILKYTKLNIKSLIEVPEQAEYLQVRKSKCYPINDYITFDVERSLLISEDDREARLTPKMVDLLEQLILSPYFYALNIDLWKNIWETEGDTSNVLTQLIRNFRDEIAIFPEVEVRSIRRKGYQLIIYPLDGPRIEPPLPPEAEGEAEAEPEEEIITPSLNKLKIEKV